MVAKCQVLESDAMNLSNDLGVLVFVPAQEGLQQVIGIINVDTGDD